MSFVAYNVKTKNKEQLVNPVLVVRHNHGRTTYFLKGKGEKTGMELWRIISHDQAASFKAPRRNSSLPLKKRRRSSSPKRRRSSRRNSNLPPKKRRSSGRKSSGKKGKSSPRRSARLASKKRRTRAKSGYNFF